MGFFDVFKKKGSSENAKKRLQMAIVADRNACSPELMENIRKDILAVLAKYMDIDFDGLDIKITQTEAEDGNGTVPALFANIPIKDMKAR